MKERERIYLALERDGLTPAGLRRRDLPIPSEEERLDDKALIRVAARRFASLTSPETKRRLIERMADAPNPMFFKGSRENALLVAEDMLEAVLRSVEEGTG